jgi:hypothetical protein
LCFSELLYLSHGWRLFFHSLLVFINFAFYFISFSSGIFNIYGYLSSSLTNSTFKNITFLYSTNTWGGAIYISTLMTILPSPLFAVFLPSAKFIMVEHYFLHQIPTTSTSAVLVSRITVLILVEMTFL